MLVYLRFALGVVLSLALLLGGCTRMREMPLTPSAADVDGVKPGDSVRLTLRDGSVHEFEVRAVEPDAIAGDGARIAKAEIVKLERKEIDVGATAAVGVAGTGLLILLLFGLALAAAAPAMFLAGG